VLGGAEQKSRAQKITEARRVGVPRSPCEPSGSERRRGGASVPFKIGSDFVKQTHTFVALLLSAGSFGEKGLSGMALKKQIDLSRLLTHRII